MSKTVAIIQARMGSKRLPAKVLKPVLGKPLLSYLLERLKKCKTLDSMGVATTTHFEDNAIATFCLENKIPFIRGSAEDVLARYVQAAKEWQAGTIVRITADCPLTDPVIVDEVISLYNRSHVDYVSNLHPRTFPRGLDVEVFSNKTLMEMSQRGIRKEDREHVTYYLRTHLEEFLTTNYAEPVDESRHRWTVDTENDFLLIKKILETLFPIKPDFRMKDVLELFKKDPSLFAINTHVEQRNPNL